MRKRMVSAAFFAVLVALVFTFVTSSFVQAQAEQETGGTEVKETAKKGRGGEAEDENIKNRSVENDPQAAPPAPPEKGGEKARGGCYLTVDNHTAWKIQIFVNGNYVGLVSPWGNAAGYQSLSSFTTYAVADFTDGSQMTWGPRVVSCSGRFTWNLWP